MGQIALENVSKKPRDDWRGYFAYLFNKEAGGANSRGILAVWYTWITMESGKTIYGNNPLNLTCRNGDGCYEGQIGWYRFPGNTRNFVAFDSPQSAAKAYIKLLSSTTYRYAPILAAARADKWQAMVTAIITSCWVSCNRHGYGGLNGSFWSVWNTMRGKVDADIASGKISDVPTTGTDDMLGAWNDLVKFPVGHILTEADVNTIIDKLDAAGYFNVAGIFTGGKDKTREILMSHVGEAWTKELQDKLQQEFFGAADAAVDNPLQAIATLLTSLLDPAKWLRIGALVLGLILVFLGFQSVMSASAKATV